MPPVIELFWADLDVVAATLPRWRALLGADEIERAGRFRFERDRSRYLVRRGILRLLLAERLDCDPATLRFTTNAYGKPALIDGGCAFNLSHSRGLGLFALGGAIELGCDIEFHDPRFLAENIPERFFSPTECRELHALPTGAQTAAFFAGWTRKEAYIKARGIGLSLPLDSFDVSLAPHERPALSRGCAGWSAWSTTPAEDCAAAVVAAGDDWGIVTRPLDPFALLANSRVAA